jgi:hypothetical protein
LKSKKKQKYKTNDYSGLSKGCFSMNISAIVPYCIPADITSAIVLLVSPFEFFVLLAFAGIVLTMCRAACQHKYKDRCRYYQCKDGFFDGHKPVDKKSALAKGHSDNLSLN